MNSIESYWERRYQLGGTSGPGSEGLEAHHKAAILQGVIDENNVKRLLDLGCGDGYVASLITVSHYVGYEPSEAARALCQRLMPKRQFTDVVPDETFDLLVSMDVIFHLTVDWIYRSYLGLLFGDRSDVVFVYGTNRHQVGHHHVLHREWIRDVPPGWEIRSIPTKFKSAWILTRL